MPGHKGRAFLGCENLDITEIRGADELYEPCGIIEQSQNNASELFGTRATFYSAEGSSLCIRAMLYLAAQRRKIKTERPVFAALSGAHKVFMLACAVLDAEVLFLNHDGEESGIFGNGISAENLEKQLESSPENLCAVYITSPDYLGHVCDIAHFKKVCEKKHLCVAEGFWYVLGLGQLFSYFLFFKFGIADTGMVNRFQFFFEN